MTPPARANSAAARDIANVLHPYTDLKAHAEVGPIVITRGEGVRVWDDTGKAYIESVAGLWCANLGFSNERLARAAYDQMLKLPFYHAFTGKSHDPLIELSEMLIARAPVPMSKVFFANSGSEANDTAIKMVTQTLPLSEAIALRGLVVTVLLWTIAQRDGGVVWWPAAPRDRLMLALRTVAEVSSTLLYLLALQFMSIGELSAIMQALPLVVMLAAALVVVAIALVVYESRTYER